MILSVLLLLSTTLFAANADPREALDETRVGVAAKFVQIRGADFSMGCEGSLPSNTTYGIVHPVKLTKDIEMQMTEVTQLQYFLVTGRNPSQYIKGQCDPGNDLTLDGVVMCANHPVEMVSWDDTNSFIQKLNGIQDIYTYRLPTEAEWEYATSGGPTMEFPYCFGFGMGRDPKNFELYAWYEKNSGRRSHAVGQTLANPFGLFDMYGNVCEWVQDYYDERYGSQDLSQPAIDPTGPAKGYLRVFKGAAVTSPAYFSFYRHSNSPTLRAYYLGFRLVRTRRDGKPLGMPEPEPSPGPTSSPSPLPELYDEDF